MSRVGKSPIVLQGAEVALSDERITVKGPLGTITQAANRLVKVVNDNGTLRMDCAQVNDGVPFTTQPSAAQQAQMEKGTAQQTRSKTPNSMPQTITTIKRQP